VGGDLGPQFGGFFCNGAADGTALGFSLGVDDDSGIILAVHEGSVGSVPGSSLTNDDGGVDLLSELLDTLLDGAKDDVSDGA